MKKILLLLAVLLAMPLTLAAEVNCNPPVDHIGANGEQVITGVWNITQDTTCENRNISLDYNANNDAYIDIADGITLTLKNSNLYVRRGTWYHASATYGKTGVFGGTNSNFILQDSSLKGGYYTSNGFVREGAGSIYGQASNLIVHNSVIDGVQYIWMGSKYLSKGTGTQDIEDSTIMRSLLQTDNDDTYVNSVFDGVKILTTNYYEDYSTFVANNNVFNTNLGTNTVCYPERYGMRFYGGHDIKIKDSTLKLTSSVPCTAIAIAAWNAPTTITFEDAKIDGYSNFYSLITPITQFNGRTNDNGVYGSSTNYWDVNFDYHLTVNVQSTTGTMVDGASVIIKDINGNQVATGTTSNGKLTTDLITAYNEHATTTTHTQTNNGPFTVEVTYNSQTVTASIDPFISTETTVTMQLNQKPVINSVALSPAQPSTEQDIKLLIDATDADGDQLTCRAGGIIGTGTEIDLGQLPTGDYGYEIYCNDGQVDSDAATISFHVNDRPKITGITVNPETPNTLDNVNLNIQVQDSDNNEFTCKVGTTTGDTTITLDPMTAGQKTYQVTCNDGIIDSKPYELSFKVYDLVSAVSSDYIVDIDNLQGRTADITISKQLDDLINTAVIYQGVTFGVGEHYEISENEFKIAEGQEQKIIHNKVIRTINYALPTSKVPFSYNKATIKFSAYPGTDNENRVGVYTCENFVKGSDTTGTCEPAKTEQTHKKRSWRNWMARARNRIMGSGKYEPLRRTNYDASTYTITIDNVDFSIGNTKAIATSTTGVAGIRRTLEQVELTGISGNVILGSNTIVGLLVLVTLMVGAVLYLTLKENKKIRL